MNLFAHSMRSKGGMAFVRRFGSVAARFGLTSAKTERNLAAYLDTLRDHGCNPTFPITAQVLRRHPTLVRRFSDAGVEFAVHGYIHTDHTTLSASDQREQLARALEVFRASGIQADGFRSPYLRYNEDTVAATQHLGFQYVSNQTISYDVIGMDSLDRGRRAAYRRALGLYSALPADRSIARPYMRGTVVEIPVAMPDDEILIDRLGCTEGTQIGAVWTEMVDLTHARGDLLTLQLHPERGIICREGLFIALGAARAKAPRVWIAQLRDIARWWRRRASLRARVEPHGGGSWLVSGPNAPDTSVLLKNLRCASAKEWYGPYTAMSGREAVVECASRPVIGVSDRSGPLRSFLEEEGYAVYSGVAPEACSVYLDRPGPLRLDEQAATLRYLELSEVPLVRLARWPDGARSAMAITGDIDALTLVDFVLRTWEVR